MKKPSIVFFDIDGTLYTQEMTLPESSKEAIKAIKDDGIYVAIATGRAPFMFESLREELDIETFVSFNGSYVVAEGEVIEKRPLETEKVEELQLAAGSESHPMVFLDHEQAAANVENHSHILESLGDLKMPYPPLSENFYKQKEIYQALLFCGKEDEDLYKNNYGTFHFVRWHKRALDVLPAGGSKAEGIRAVANHLGYTMEDTAAFGDALNDMEMLTEAGIGIAMGNALEEVKQAADIVTSPVYENGVQQGLKRIGLL
ncbi:Cof-type HAD-IIB family hydrolase [Alteribacillus sp. YIM 98480]|uniref:Cof-type HAD-IIB family hydrolase n=1 Tax=Alteribacillus sp. YIM 98480 TaxID=2606599 RepID=UPI00131BC37C|nr:Cof-type HAD-IIB family hydrolase [Alteribacillus sp. YIM 98480]